MCSSDLAQVADVWVEDAEGKRVPAVPHGEPFALCALIDVREQIDAPDVHLTLNTDDALHVFAVASGFVEGHGRDPFAAGEQAVVRVTIENQLGDGRYFVDCSVHASGRGMVVFRGRACDFVVFGAPEPAGLVTLPNTVSVQRQLERVP